MDLNILTFHIVYLSPAPPDQDPVFKVNNSQVTSGSSVTFHKCDKVDITCTVTGVHPLVSKVIINCTDITEETSQIKKENAVVGTLSLTVTISLHNKICRCSAKHMTEYDRTSYFTIFINCKYNNDLT